MASISRLDVTVDDATIALLVQAATATTITTATTTASAAATQPQQLIFLSRAQVERIAAESVVPQWSPRHVSLSFRAARGDSGQSAEHHLELHLAGKIEFRLSSD